MAKWLAGQTAVLTVRVRAPHDFRFSAKCKVIALPAFCDAITGPTEFIISIVNSVKMVNMPSQSEIYRRVNAENDWNSSVVRRSPSKAIIGFPIISNAGSAAFPMLALVENARDSVL